LTPSTDRRYARDLLLGNAVNCPEGIDVYVVLAWFADHMVRDDLLAVREERFTAAAGPLIPSSYVEQRIHGRDWTVRVQHAQPGPFRWPVFAGHNGITAVSLGLPVGIDTSGGPVSLASRLLRGEDVHAEVVPPFSLIAVEAEERFAIQQDWLGMGRLFTASDGGITAFCNRPSLLAAFLWGRREPDIEGWRSYTATGHFGGDSSPIRGVRLMRPGERFIGRRRPDGGWSLTSQIRRSADDLVAEGMAAQAQGPDAAVEEASEGLLTIARSVDDLYTGDITIGLSGGKDSRLVAASFLAAGRPVRFSTNVDDPVEGDTAQELMRIIREQRGLESPHRLSRVSDPANVLAASLYSRTSRLQSLYDYQFPSSYLARPAVAQQLPAPRTVSFSGVGGELAVAYWYPDDSSGDLDRDVARATAIKRLNAAVPAGTMQPDAYACESARVAAIADRAEDLGLLGQAITDYVYLIERVRRWYSSAYLFGVVTPFLSPAFVKASFALTAAQKRQWTLHHGGLGRFVPEWSGVPFVSGKPSGKSTAAAIWDGDGASTIRGLLYTTGGPLTAAIQPAAVREALENCAAGASPVRRCPTLLQQFTALAVATHTLMPDAVRVVEPSTSGELTIRRRDASHPEARARSRWTRSMARRLRFVKRSPWGRRVWSAVRNRSG
jgi:asparagine synthase (glutamine-hydrolysing)